jgi:hypothetical protein
MALSYLLLFLTFLTLRGSITVAASTNDTDLIEQLFLDVSVHDIISSVDGIPAQQPWAGQYVTAIREKRFGDAIWARYHMMGEVEDGIVGDTNLTVLQSIEEDAVGYKSNAPEQFSHALSVYANTSIEDTHSDVLQLISNARVGNLSTIEARTTYGIKCSDEHLGYRTSCYEVLERTSQERTLIRDRRLLYSYMSCHLRVGPLGAGADLTFHTAHLVARLIEEQCGRVPSCCNSVKVSGYSPTNAGHRKVCFSSKSTGCN